MRVGRQGEGVRLAPAGHLASALLWASPAAASCAHQPGSRGGELLHSSLCHTVHLPPSSVGARAPQCCSAPSCSHSSPSSTCTQLPGPLRLERQTSIQRGGTSGLLICLRLRIWQSPGALCPHGGDTGRWAEGTSRGRPWACGHRRMAGALGGAC